MNATRRKQDRWWRFRELTNNSAGLGLSFGSFLKQSSTNLPCLDSSPQGSPSFGAGSLTMCWRRSRMDMVMPPPPSETPCDLRFSPDEVVDFWRGGRGVGSEEWMVESSGSERSESASESVEVKEGRGQDESEQRVERAGGLKAHQRKGTSPEPTRSTRCPATRRPT